MKTICFGKYYKDETLEKEKIEWLVLDEDDEALFIVSKKALASRPFDLSGNGWEKSDIRKWLNSEFYYEAFKSEERHYIQRTDVETEDVYGMRCGWTQDELFLLSFEEVEEYFPDPISRIQEKSQWAQSALEEDRKDTIAWWLRDKGAYDSAGLMVLEDGKYESMGGTQNVEGIRPAMWIHKSYIEYVDPETPVLEGQLGLFDAEEN